MGFGSESPDLTLDVSDENRKRPRLWLQSATGDRVVQLQQDRIVVNWKQGTNDSTYPRYRSIRKALLDAWDKLRTSINDLDLDMPQPSICEAQYIKPSRIRPRVAFSRRYTAVHSAVERNYE